jgi:exo-beta-1,3-glucanase (GH17 family)
MMVGTLLDLLLKKFGDFLLSLVFGGVAGWLTRVWGLGRGQRALVICSLALFAGVLWNEIIGPQYLQYIITAKAERFIPRRRWIGYDPRTFDPYRTPNPSIGSIEGDLAHIKQAGFTGVITFSSKGTLSSIPKLAKSHGFAVIMGVWDPTDRQEVSRAIGQSQHVDGYCVGHDGLGPQYSYEELEDAIRHIRFRTGLPVSTTERLQRYLDKDGRLLKLGDWVFPDIHTVRTDEKGIVDPADADSAIGAARNTIGMANQISTQELRNGKPVLLKMVSYPYSGAKNASLENQAVYFEAIFRVLRDVSPSVPSDVYISVYGAFDAPWKNGPSFDSWEPYAGLFDSKGAPRPAVGEIVNLWPPVKP